MTIKLLQTKLKSPETQQDIIKHRGVGEAALLTKGRQL